MRSCRQDLVDKIMQDAEQVRVLSSAEYWERMHRLRCLALYRQEQVVISEQLPTGQDAYVYAEIKAIGNRACNAIERHESAQAAVQERRNDAEINPLAAMATAWTSAIAVADQLRGQSKSAPKSEA